MEHESSPQAHAELNKTLDKVNVLIEELRNLPPSAKDTESIEARERQAEAIHEHIERICEGLSKGIKMVALKEAARAMSQAMKNELNDEKYLV